MRMPRAVGRRGPRLQCSRAARQALPLVQPRPHRPRDHHDAPMRTAVGRFAARPLELARPHARRDRAVSRNRAAGRARHGVDGWLLVTSPALTTPASLRDSRSFRDAAVALQSSKQEMNGASVKLSQALFVDVLYGELLARGIQHFLPSSELTVMDYFEPAVSQLTCTQRRDQRWCWSGLENGIP